MATGDGLVSKSSMICIVCFDSRGQQVRTLPSEVLWTVSGTRAASIRHTIFPVDGNPEPRIVSSVLPSSGPEVWGLGFEGLASVSRG